MISRLDDPGDVASVANRLELIADGLDTARRILRPSADSAWRGPAAAAVVSLLVLQPREFDAAASACRSAASALRGHSAVLAECQALMQHATTQGSAASAERAQATAAASARRAAGELHAAARAAPRRPNLLERVWRGLMSTQAETRLGLLESAENLLSLFSRFNQGRLATHPHAVADDVTDTARGLAQAARDPASLAKDLIDWDTWRASPARAAGHLAPDLIAAVISGGATTSLRGAEIANRSRTAIATAATGDAVRRSVVEDVARSSRERLVDAAITGKPYPNAASWVGEGGTRLTPAQNAAADEFWQLTARAEPDLTRRMRGLAEEVDGRLVGLDQRLKEPESLKRKIATHELKRAAPISELLNRAEDTVRYTVVLDDRSYVTGALRLAERLERLGYHGRPVSNAWFGPRYRGVNSTWVDPDSGVAFEIQFHTAASWAVTKKTHPMYQEMRLPETPPERATLLERLIAAEYTRAAPPDGVATLSDATFPPPTPPAPIDIPPNHAPAAALGGAGTTAVIEAGSESDRGP